ADPETTRAGERNLCGGSPRPHANLDRRSPGGEARPGDGRGTKQNLAEGQRKIRRDAEGSGGVRKSGEVAPVAGYPFTASWKCLKATTEKSERTGMALGPPYPLPEYIFMREVHHACG